MFVINGADEIGCGGAAERAVDDFQPGDSTLGPRILMRRLLCGELWCSGCVSLFGVVGALQ